MPVEVWKLMGRNPTQSAILLRAEDNGADVIPGTCLLEMEKGEEIEVFPAMYRLRRIGSNSHGDEGGLSKKMSLAD